MSKKDERPPRDRRHEDPKRALHALRAGVAIDPDPEQTFNSMLEGDAFRGYGGVLPTMEGGELFPPLK